MFKERQKLGREAQMPELRQEPITKKWVIIATERSKRPSDFPVRPEKRKGGSCPFCVGNESKTPPEITAYRKEGTQTDSPGWWVRVVPNLFPALKSGEEGPQNQNFYVTRPGLGAHEVLIESPDHNSTLEEHSLDQARDIFQMWVDRYRAVMEQEDIKYVQIFKNEGSIAGASLEHPHSQLIATPLVPPFIAEELKGAKEYHTEQGHCIYCDMIAHEIEEGERVVAEKQDFISFCPYASRFPFETWIMPKRHQASFGSLDSGQLQSLTEIVQETMQKITGSLNNPPYNMVLHSAPSGEDDAPYYHWHLEVLPRLTIVAGFEWGTGIIINPTPPESAAKYLRETSVQNNRAKEELVWQQIH
jgi:UDPglucose--hexose-1-phosphate uridylyltransferase